MALQLIARSKSTVLTLFAACLLTAANVPNSMAQVQPTLRVKDSFALVRENDSRGTNLTLKVSLSPASDRVVLVKFTTTDGTATAPSDYTAASGTLIFPPGTTEQVLSIHVNGNTSNEPNEAFYVDFSEPFDARLETPRVTCAIYDDNPTPIISIDDTRVVEGDQEFTVSAFFKLHLSFPTEKFVLVDMQTISGSAHEMNFLDPLSGDGDYYGSFGSVGFPPGETETEIEIPLNSDTVVENNETFSVAVSSTSAQMARNSATATIVDDDLAPAISIKDASIRELSYSSTNVIFSVTLSKPSADPVEVAFITKDETALADLDYIPKLGSLVFNPGTTNQTISIEILSDKLVETLETFFIELSQPSNGVLGIFRATGTLLDAVNEIPIVAIDSPTATDSFNYPDNIPITASATDIDGAIQRVEFFINDQKLGEALQAPYAFVWTSPLPGQYKVVAKAFDNEGAGASSTPLTVTISSNAKVSITSPATDTVFASGEFINVATTIDSTVQPTSVEFWSDNGMIGSDDTAPFAFVWQNAPVGVHLLTAKAIQSGTTFESAPVRITVGPTRPVNNMFADAIELTGFSPESNSTTVGAATEAGEPAHGSPAAGASVWWRWTAPADGVLTITTSNSLSGHFFIALYTGDSLANLSTVGKFQDFGSLTVNSGATYRIAVDGVNDQRSAVFLQLALSAVTIIAPTQNSIYTAPAAIPFTIAANDSGASVGEVEVRQGAQTLATLAGPPFNFTWTNVPNGYYQVYAVGKDHLGGLREAPAVFLTVKPQNDDFENAIWLYGYSTNIHTSNYGATLQVTTRPGERRDGEATGLADNEGGRSIWYNWTSPDDGLAILNGQGSNFPLLLAASVGDDVLHLGRIAVNATTQLPVVFTARKGITYRISVDGLEGQEGQLDWSLSLHPHNDDFANRTVFTGSSYEAFASPLGSTTEAFEVPLKYPTNSISQWWSWAAPAAGPVTISAISDSVPTQLLVCTGDPFALSIVRKTTTWSTNSTVTFTAQAGKLYHFAVLNPSNATENYLVRLFLDILQITSPSDASVYEVPAAVPLSVSKFGGLTNVQRVDYLVNGVVALSSTESPYSAVWSNSVPGNYVISAKAILSSGSLSSLGHSIQLYEGHQLPQPRLIKNIEFGHELWVINAVGSIFALGNSIPTFGAPATGLNQLPTQGKWPPGVQNWSEISCVNSYQDSHTWSLTDDGVLYKDNQTRIPFPAGVTKWVKLTPGATVVGDDGNFYQLGAQLISRPPAGIRWKDAGGGNTFYTLSVDGRLFLQGRDNFNNPIATEIPFPAGVSAWSEMKMAVNGGLLRANDGRLFRIGSALGNNPTGPEPVPLPPGVTHFVSFTTGNLHFLAIGDDGELYSWGYNMSGQLGIGSSYLETTTLQKVIKPPGVTGWMAIGAGAIHSAALGNDCSLYVWGSNDFGQLAIGPLLSQAVPTRVDNLGSLCGIPVIFTQGSDSQLPGGAFGIRFPTDLNRPYTVQYSDDVQTWKSAFPNVLGNGGILDWIDNGPPATETAPSQTSQRFYRAIFAE